MTMNSMNIANRVFKKRLFLTLLILILCTPALLGQKQIPPPQSDDVVRVKTELVQNDVTIVDKHGRLVEGLRPEQFELRVDGQPQPLTLVEEIFAGGRDEEKQLKAAR